MPKSLNNVANKHLSSCQEFAVPLKHPLSPSPRFPVNLPTSLNPATSDQGLPFLSVPLTYHSLIPPYPRGTGFSFPQESWKALASHPHFPARWSGGGEDLETTTLPSGHCPEPKPLHKTLYVVYSSFIVVKTWKQTFSRCMDKLWYILTLGYYSVPKRNELSGHEKTWRRCKDRLY